MPFREAGSKDTLRKGGSKGIFREAGSKDTLRKGGSKGIFREAGSKGTFTSTMAMCFSLFQGLPNSVVIQYCGHVFLIAEVDSASQVSEPDETNNVRAASVFIPCKGGIYVTQPTYTHSHTCLCV